MADSWTLGLFLLSLVTLFGGVFGLGLPKFFSYWTLNHLSSVTTSLLQMNSLFVWHLSPHIDYLLLLYILWFLSFIMSLAWEESFLTMAMRSNVCTTLHHPKFVPFGHILTCILSFSIAKKYKVFPVIWLL